ncbi:MAG: 50S ribosomal protein L16 [Cytophagales bacterium]|nr:50S ribosomal protein L16 [Cytophagales bacterium]
MLQPKKTKFRKQQKGRVKGLDVRGSELSFGSYGIKAIGQGQVSAKQIENIRVIISKNLGKTGKMWIKIFPDRPVTRKGNGVRMGSGKGNVEFWAAVVRPGKIMFEIDGIEAMTAKRVAGLIDDKLTMPIKLVTRPDMRII